MRTALTLVGSLALAMTIGCSNNPAAPGGTVASGGSLGIIGGTFSGGGSYQSVGALLFDFDQNGILNGDDQLCTGSLVSPTVVLTAGHCLSFLAPGSALHVTFAADLYAPGLVTIAATGYAIDPQYGHDQADPRDIGIVTLPTGSTAGLSPLTLPPAGLLDTLAGSKALDTQIFVNVGYGVDATSRGRPTYSYDGKRKVSTSPFRSLQKSWLSLAMTTAATGLGGDCYGDSGGPKFLAGNSSMIVATVSWGDSPCRSLSKNYRLDTGVARSFLSRFVSIP